MSKFNHLKEKLARKGARSPGGLAAYIGRKNLGKKEMERRSEAGRRRKGRRK